MNFVILTKMSEENRKRKRAGGYQVADGLLNVAVGVEHAFVEPLSDSGAGGTPGSATEKRAK